MASYNIKGRYGERLAAFYLETWGFNILELNWRYSYYEVDIIASLGDVLHVIEVKLRTDNSYGYPEESVSKKKFESMATAAEEFMYQHPQWVKLQFDVMAITISKKEFAIVFIEDIFEG